MWTQRRGNSARELRVGVSSFLVLVLLFVDLFAVLEYGIFTATKAEAATGDFSIFQETAGGTVIAGTDNALTWDNPIEESVNIDLLANTSDIDLVDGGKYLVLYNAWTEEGSSGGGNRRSVASYLTVDGAASEYGWGGGYIRDSENDFTAYNSGAAILDVSAGADLALVLDRDDANAGGGTEVRDNTNGISVLKLDDGFDYLRVHASTRSADISGNTDFTGVEWDTADEVDTGSFGFASPTSSVTVKGGAEQKFLVTTNVKLNVDGTGGPRQNYELRLTLDGVEVPGTRSTAYIRFDNGDLNSTLQYTGIIKKATSSDQVLAVEVRREGPEFVSTDIVGDQSALAMVALPTDAEVLSIVSTADETLTTGQSTLSFGDQISTAPSFLSHSTSSASDDVNVDTGGDYLVFATTYTSRTSGTDRNVPKIDWLIDGTTQNYGGHGHYNRGDQSTDDAFTSGGSSGAIFPGLTGGQVIELAQSDETTGTPDADFIADRVAMQVIELGELNESVTTNVSVNGSQTATTSKPANDIFSGQQIAVVESSAARNVTNIVVTESGSIDAANNLSNVRLFYESDTTNPYNCVSESYAGTESQFGTAETFSGADGTVTFTDSVSISQTSALCAYVVFDVESEAMDGETINFLISNPATDVIVTAGGVVTPTESIGDISETTVEDPGITQTGYHWRNDDGNETAATSATGAEDTPGLSFSSTTPQRLRIGVAANGTGEQTNQYRLEYGQKVTTCSAVGSWIDVGDVGGDWDMFDSSFITDGNDTTNISVAAGGVTDQGVEFVTPNAGLKDTSSQTGDITISNAAQGTIAEFGNTTITNGAVTTVNLTETFYDPVIVTSVRYDRTSTQRTPRIDSKASSSFDIIIDNYNGTLTGTTNFDYVVFERGDWLVDDGGSGTRVYADSVETSVVSGRTLPTDPGGPTITYPTSFPGEPAVVTTVVTRNDPQWVFSSVYQGADIENPPSANDMKVFLNDNFDNDGHGAAETIDFIVFEQGHDTSNTFEFDSVTTGAATIANTPVAINYSSAFGGVPAVILTHQLTHNGTDGGYSQIDTNTAPTASAVTVSIDEEGEDSGGTLADRAHAAEEVGVISFASAGTFEGQRADLKQFVELEYSIQATVSAVEGVAYCFRVTDAGTELSNYTVYPEATLNADVTVAAIGTQVATVDRSDIGAHIGGSFSVVDNTGSRNVTSVTIAEAGTVDEVNEITRVRLFYELDTSAPYDCSSESYAGTELQFGSDGIFSTTGTSTFTDSVGIVSGASSLCLYPVIDLSSTTTDGDTIEIGINNPSSDVSVSTGSVGPGSGVELSGTTLTQAPFLQMENYHWRNDDGAEADATSASGGVENTSISDIFQGSTRRLRLAVSNEGSLAETSADLRLEYGTRVTSCSAVVTWQRIDSGVAFDMDATSGLTNGSDTTNIAIGDGGVSDPNTTFLTPNSAQLESGDEVSSVALSTTEFIELEFALEITDESAFGATYCLRVTNGGEALDGYTNYAEISIQERQDIFVQRGTETVSGTSQTVTAGVDYQAPASTSSAFVRITNTNMTGAGSDTLGAQRAADDITAYIAGPVDLTTSFTIERPSTATDNTRVSWEILEYIGVEGGDNEFVVRDADALNYGGSSFFATGTAASGVVDDTDVVVFITGQLNPSTGNDDFNVAMSISSWAADTDQPVFERGDTDSLAAGVSYAVVEFTGANWGVQRAEHTYSAAGVAETEVISVVNSLSRTFIHSQKLAGDELDNLDENGHEVFLSSLGAVTFQLESGATSPSEHRSVAWVIENTQTGDGAMQVYRASGQIDANASQPTAFVFGIGATVNTSDASITANARSSGAGNFHPRVVLGARILNETQFELWKSDEGQNQNYRVEIIDWPVAESSVRQSYYRFYVDNDALTPTDPWPVGVSNLGENTEITDLDEPIGETERVRIRTALLVNNASVPADGVNFKLQYGRQVTTCAAIATWTDVGASGSGEIWRGFDATPVDGTPVASTSLLISVSDVAGTYEEGNPSATNPDAIDIGQHVEYDWLVENNGALQKSSYCFRMINGDDTALDGYDVYPTLRTSGYTPIIDNWRWYDDETNETPSSALAAEQVGPSDIAFDNTIKLRISTTEIAGAPGNSIKFNLQFSQFSDFSDGGTTLTSTSSCTASSTWCYADGAGTDNAIVDTTVLSGVDSCVSGVGEGCGTVNEAEGLSSTYNQPALTTSEHEFTLVHRSASVNTVYYFRLVDATNGVNLLASTSYPSLVTEGAVLTFGLGTVNSGTVIDGQTMDVDTTATVIDFDFLPLGTDVLAAQQLSVYSNGTNGYRVFVDFDQPLTDIYGNTFPSISGTNAAPVTWESECTGMSTSCFGYHAVDDVLFGGSTRFASDNTYAGIEPQPVEVMAVENPVTFDVAEVVYRVRAGTLQPAGNYSMNLSYIIVPIY